ncbi:glycerophosphodiester phosphodiesterase [Arthrobacter citreus]|uniref:glycerophosphodiester phosphodiesterase n=1 Tax=Arthrobacter citreus TaxID=1670 RepID=UPI0036DE291F
MAEPSRRLFLGAGAALLLAGCAAQPPGGALPGTPDSRTAPRAGGATVSSLLNQSPFHIAHRGSGDNWPEHTMAAYQGAVDAGAPAIEVSVCATRDGVLVCHHDTNTLRMTGADLEIADSDYGRITVLKNDARSWLGPGARLEPIPRLEDVLDRFAGNQVIFIEDKQGTNTQALLGLMDKYPDANEHFVWKQTAGAPGYEAAASRGYRTWGYFIDNSNNQFEALAPKFDLLGIYHGATDEEIKALVAFGKPVICWEIHTRWMRDRVLGLGVRGLMCSNYPYVAGDEASAARDAFATGVRSAGDLPWVLGLKYQPEILPREKTVRLAHDSTSGYLLGSMGPLTSGDQEIQLEIRWPELPPGRHAGAGLAFGMPDDSPYRAGIPGTVGGYHVLLRASGAVEVYRRNVTRGEEATADELIGSFATEPVASGTWTGLSVSMDSQGLTVKRRGGAEAWSASIPDTAYRGGYLGLLKSYPDPVAVDFRSVTAGSATA